MNKKIFNSISILLMFILSFFCLGARVSAKYKMTSVRPNNYYKIEYKTKNMNNEARTLYNLFIFVASDANDNPKHAYCIQPGISMAVWNGNNYTRTGNGIVALSSYSGDDEPKNAGLGYNSYYTNSTIKNKILQVLNYAYEYKPDATTFADFANSAINISVENYQKIIAAQAIIWELVTQERTSFNSYVPDNKVSGGLYDALFAGSDSSKFSYAQQEYKRIIDSVYYSYYKSPGNNNSIFKIESMAKTIKTTIGQTYEIKDSDGAFKYFKKVSAPDGVNVEVSDSGVKITPTKAISSDSPAIVKIGLKNVKDVNSVYTCTEDPGEANRSGCQDLAYGGVNLELAIKVYTTKYDIKIIKKDEESNPLSGAKFNICKDAKCSNVLNDEPLVSGSDGIVTYSEIAEPGTYYVQEIEAPSGYKIDNTIKSIEVPNSTSVEFTNTSRQFNLIKYTIDENGVSTLLDDGCGTEEYTGPEFKLTNLAGNLISFEMLSNGEYKQADEDTENSTTVLKTCDGKFSVKLLTSCNYIISETKAPNGLTLPTNASKKVNICGSDKNISFTNGFTGLEFQKKNEDGEFISGGKFALQRKENNVYKDVLLRENTEGYYTYDTSIDENDPDATYILLTNDGIARIDSIAPGEYRVVEKEAPEGYEAIEDKDSTAKITINDGQQEDYYVVELINKKVNLKGDEASAELIVTITTGRKVLNYTLIFVGLAAILGALILIRKKTKK